MKTRLWIYVAAVCCLTVITINCSWAGYPTTIVDSGPLPGGYRVEWVPSGASALVLWTPALDVPFTDISGSVHFSQNAYTDTVHGAESKGFYQVEFESPPGLVLIPAGSLAVDDPDFGFKQLNVPSDLYMDRTEVTKAQWAAVRSWAVLNGYSLTGGGGKGPDHPVNNISWYEATKWCNARSEMEGSTPCYTLDGVVFRTGAGSTNIICDFNADGFRLPKENEWEYAARAGYPNRRFSWGDTISHSQANYRSSTDFTYDVSPTQGDHPDYDSGGYPYTNPVEDFPYNEYGLYGMVGNLREWCFENPVDDDTGWVYWNWRIARGGGSVTTADQCRLGDSRGFSVGAPDPNTGFRCVRLAN